MVFAEESTTAAFLLRARREGIRDFGACMAPMTAFQILQGIETLPLRMAAPRREHAQDRRVPRASIRWSSPIGYPELPEHPDHALAQRAAAARLRRGVQLSTCAARASRAASSSRSLRIFSHLANVGDAKSLVIHPASTTHFRMSAGGSAAAGITEGTIRLVGRPRGRRPT